MMTLRYRIIKKYVENAARQEGIRRKGSAAVIARYYAGREIADILEYDKDHISSNGKNMLKFFDRDNNIVYEIALPLLDNLSL